MICSISAAQLKIKGNPDYREYQSIAIKPYTKSSCIKCGFWAKNCPSGAISLKNEKNKCVNPLEDINKRKWGF